ncbi:MAG: hypothetical protein Pg6A_00280 [Termitinemataceae bacterium]|jgi:hypothetical protein|nr:MAG: hypothetical protein Pg6A_00280 [Termitinemataceae bacterium]
MEKHTGLMIVFIIFVNAMVFSNENRLSLGFEYGNFFEKRTDGGVDIETYIGSPGFNFSGYHLWNDFGFFHSHSFLFPAKVLSNRDGYKYIFEYGFTIGPAFKIIFTGKLDMTLGLGFSLGNITGKQNNKSISLFRMGIAGDIGLSFFVNKYICINIGSLISYHFLNTTSIANGTHDKDGDENETTEWSKNYNMAGLRPYIKIRIPFK